MKATPSLRTADHRKGIALVLVLGILVILSALIIAFFTSVRTDSASSRAYSVGVQSRRLADEALNIVTAQIQDATAQSGQAWVSQPGMIRNFDTSGNLVTAYKLYSATNMRETSFNPLTTSDAPPVDWFASPAVFADLNAPVYLPDASGSATIGSEKYNPVYPIMDPTAAYDATTNPNGVRGFSLSGAPVETGTSPNPAPMPTRWLYVLRDGSLVAAASGAAGTATVAGATDANPIVGRVAFWTDDETCKVNINTAAGDLWASNDPGSFVDMPRAETTFERNLSRFQPVNKEFQRYPGHPATTYLSAVFPSLTRDDIAAIAPKIVPGGSVGGTVAGPASLTADTHRLYASVDEMLYSSTYDTGSPAKRNPNPALDAAAVGKAGFFLTAHSRAPEVNLFNRPRITIWPEPAVPADRTTFDKTIAFCSTVGGDPFYFVRNNSASQTEDFANFPRNIELYRYMQNLTGDAFSAAGIPGFGGSFKTKYGADRDQILTEIFDYTRCINLFDSSQPAVAKRFATGPATPTQIGYCPAGTGQVVPIQITAPQTGVQTQGFGRFPTIYSPTLLLLSTSGTPQWTSATLDPPGKTTGLQAVFLLECFTPSHGVMRLVPNVVIEVQGLDTLLIDGVPSGFPNSARVNYNGLAPYHDYGWGSLEGAANLFAGAGAPKPLGTGYPSQYPFFSSVLTVDKPVNATWDPNSPIPSTVNLISGSITVRVFSREKNGAVASTPVQTLQFTFPSTDIPTPRMNYGVGTTAAFDPRLDAYFSTESLTQWFDSTRGLEPATGDARLIAASNVLSAAAFKPHVDYANSGLRFAHSLRCGNNLMRTGRDNAAGRLVEDAPHVNVDPSNLFPVAPSFLNGAYLVNSSGGASPGDWDSGMGVAPDGPYIGKPDEGEVGANAYFSWDARDVQPSLFSPNRQVPSPAIFGSLPTGVKASQAAFAANNPNGARAWQTLLFCPNPPAKALHPGKVSPPDHLLLDLFTMPVVEPYPISEPFSTAGKINLNHQIVPFTYITRNTGLQAVLKSTQVTAIPTSDANVYKSGAGSANYRHPIDPDQTLAAFDTRFANNKPFISASEICDMFLIPAGVGATTANIATWWDAYALTGDNLREKPYADIYGRLTTKSNTFTVHVRAQSLKKRPNSAPNEWKEGSDIVSGEYRGSSILERYLNPNIASYDENTELTDYKVRVLETKQFANGVERKG